MFNWIKRILYKIKGAQPIIGDVGLVNINPEVKFADTQNNNLIIGGNDKRNQTFFNFGMTYQDVHNMIQKELLLAHNKLMSEIAPRLLPNNWDEMKQDYAFLQTYLEAIKISAQKHNTNIDKTIEEIIIDRINTKNDFLKIISQESIRTISKLLEHQFRILHILALFHKCKIEGKETTDLIQNLTVKFKPLYDTQFKTIDFEYLSYTGCLSLVEPGYIDFNQKYNSNRYPNIDIKSVQESDVYQFIKKKWENSDLKRYRPTAIGTYIGLKYHKVKFNIDIPNIEKILEK
ncbi:LPO_1073/Vpar_1526 family protein [Candidatus Avelusimicrobium alvi]|jgi:hypothetical protein|uniref:LPO_1073/Vpar_1526 family protein n=1 Tax=Candidatus Avelusimicrobium alvi TaxID=3416221 RepID=UPI003D14F89B